MRTWIVVLALMLTPVAASGQDTFQEGFDAAERGDYATALEMWRPLAEQGHAIAQYNLGIMYANGRGVPQDDVEAVKWYRLAAEQGYAPAQSNLGAMYAVGEGVPEDDVEAVTWYRLAAEQGFAIAQYYLGAMYGRGEGVPQDDVLAYMWSNLAAASLTGAARDSAAENRDLAASKLTPDQRIKAQEMARDWKPTTGE